MKGLLKIIYGACAGTMVALALIALFHSKSWGRGAGPVINVETTPINRDAVPATSFAPIVKKAAPSVVNIYTTRIVRVQQRFNPYFQFPGDTVDRTRKVQYSGSGVIVSPDGYILTANHVVAGMNEIKVALGDGSKKEYIATVVGTDPQTDIAVLKIEARYLSAITLADSDQLEVGDVVLAIGNPFNIGQTVTMGIVSALGRIVEGLDNPLQNFIQTDAAINEGNSGGALVDAQGRLVGINTAIASSSKGNEGIGFAVPINMARHVMERLISDGKVTRGFLGVNLQDLDADLATAFGLPDQNGALIADAVSNLPAAKAGIQSGDVLIAFNGKSITDVNSLLLAVSDCQPGSEATVKLIRNGSSKTVRVTLAEAPVQNTNAQPILKPSGSKTDSMDGVTVRDIDRAARQNLGIPNAIQGALVADVVRGSDSFDAGLRPGDVMVEVNRQTVNTAEDAVKFCKMAKTKQILVKVWRRAQNGGFTKWLTVDNVK